MRGRITNTRALLALNGGLLLLLGAVTLAPMAEAQERRRAPGEYTMVAARPLGLAEDALIVVDATNMELMALRYDKSGDALRFIDFRDLASDLDQSRNRRR